MRYPAYPKYKEANIKWSPSIPSEWDDTMVKFCFDIQLGKMLQPKSENINDVEFPYLKALHVNWDNVDTDNLPKMFASKSDIEKYVVAEGDLLVCEGGEVGRAALIKKLTEPTIIQNALHRVRSDELGDVNFFSYMLRNISDAGWFDILCNKATIAHLTGEKLSAIRIPVPPINEQKTIATFLDFKSQQIDQLIEKKKALIKKLKEHRIALITQAVTRGLDQNAKLKPSGVEWLGNVPEHWDVKRLRFSINSNPVKSEVVNYDDDTLVSFVPMDSVSEYGGMDVSQEKPIAEVYSGYTYFLDGDVVIAKITPCFENGKGSLVPALSNGIGFGTTEFHVVRALDNLDSEYLFFLSISDPFRAIGASEMFGAGGQKRVPEDFIKDFKFGLPPIEEQIQIVLFLKEQLNKVDNMKAANFSAIEMLEEYRSVIITSAVTGKIDVREFEIPKEAI
jgi:type I restriction enzyme S subunit